MLTLEIPNFKEANTLEAAKVAADTRKGLNQFKIDNPQNIHAYDFILVGRVGGSGSQIYQIYTVADDTVTLLTALEQNIERGTIVTRLAGDKIKLYRAPFTANTAPALTDYVAITDGLIDIDPDQETSFFNDPDGSDQFYYRYTYFNSYTNQETSLGDSEDRRDRSSTDYATIDEIRHEAGFDDTPDVTDEDLDRKRAAAQSIIDGMLAGKYVLPFPQPTSPTITDLTIRLAAGMAMITEYGTFDGQDKSKGEKKRDDAMAELKLIQAGTMVITDLESVTTLPESNGGFDSSFGESTQREAMFTTRDRY